MSQVHQSKQRHVTAEVCTCPTPCFINHTRWHLRATVWSLVPTNAQGRVLVQQWSAGVCNTQPVQQTKTGVEYNSSVPSIARSVHIYRSIRTSGRVSFSCCWTSHSTSLARFTNWWKLSWWAGETMVVYGRSKHGQVSHSSPQQVMRCCRATLLPSRPIYRRQYV